MVEVRKATAADVPELAEALARSFYDDPVMTYVIPEKNRARRMRQLFELDLRYYMLPHAETYTTVGPVMGAAMWAPPNKWKTPASVAIRSAPRFLRVIGLNLRQAVRMMQVVEKAHPREHHYYLSTLGTEPDFQRKGVGSALLQPVLQKCDTEGIPAYLESSKEANVAFYRSHGFEVTKPITIPDGPTLWLMWREPQSSTTR